MCFQLSPCRLCSGERNTRHRLPPFRCEPWSLNAVELRAKHEMTLLAMEPRTVDGPLGCSCGSTPGLLRWRQGGAESEGQFLPVMAARLVADRSVPCLRHAQGPSGTGISCTMSDGVGFQSRLRRLGSKPLCCQNAKHSGLESIFYQAGL